MQRVFVLLLIICASSCEYFNAKKIASEDIFKEEISAINWNDVDNYPTFSSCDSLQVKTDRKSCFENTLSQHITNSLQNETIIVSQDIEDTILLEFQVSKTGKISIKHINLSETIEVEIPEIKNMISNSLNSLPQIYPALKRDQPVKAEFKLPIIIKVD
ncbi:hypothetical protein [Lacinutrix venerupis]|uniref:TonB C-terminal domain-containing protein n=1 Tax=Lacinutrix venerupis TaxID=1486034 RepID=A0AAC9LKX9_9FLAO|nr:hypothetical protein [Lacinutrix venerupis]APX99299.1 hypothetical protein BWR22_02905 [Lacinutrix venerupis]